VLLEAVPPTEIGVAATKSPSWLGSTEVELARQGSPGVAVGSPPRRSGAVRQPFSRKLPPTCAPPRWFAGARHAAWDMDDSSLGVRSPSAFRAQASLRRFTSPTPSALRVSHPLSDLRPPGPCGSVSRHIRPWGLFTAFRAFPTQPAVTPLDARCSPAVSASSGLARASSSLAFAPAFDYPSSPFSPRSPPRRLTVQPRQSASTSARTSSPPRWVRARASGPSR
jgi:hypothetical protein